MEELSFEKVKNLIPERRPDSHKGSFGTLFAVCGSAYYRGAAALACESALRCGAGIVRLASTEKVCAAVAARLPEVTFLPLAEGKDGEISGFSASDAFGRFPNITAALCGCGLTVTPVTRGIVSDLIENAPCTLVLDADALNCIKDAPGILRKAKKTPAITPHWGEFARLCGITVDDVACDPAGLAAAFAKDNGCVTVLKSHFTVIAAPDGEAYVSHLGNAGLARGGSGDVLAGMIASFAAQGLSAFDAARLGCALHGTAADRCAARLGMTGMLPHDIISDSVQLLKESEK